MTEQYCNAKISTCSVFLGMGKWLVIFFKQYLSSNLLYGNICSSCGISRTYSEFLSLTAIAIYVTVPDVHVPPAIRHLAMLKRDQKLVWEITKLDSSQEKNWEASIAESGAYLHRVGHKSKAIWEISYSKGLQALYTFLDTWPILPLRTFPATLCSLTRWS